MLKYFAFFLSSAITFNVTCAEDKLINECPITPAIWETIPFPGIINKTNDLRHKTGSPEFAEGQFIEIKGKVLDSNCVPVTEAIVEIWQNDAAANAFDPVDNSKLDPNFNYSGTSITNNLGEFNFFTILPGSKDKEAPHINFRVKHADFLPLETYMYFPHNINNDSDPTLKNLVDKNKRNLVISDSTETHSGSVVYNFNLTLEGVNKYKRY
jgi:protocatechuate 3,4-dioxygenase beta subunit